MTKSSKYLNNSSEYNQALTFLKAGCECGCSSTVDQDKFASLRSQFQSLEKIEQDAILMKDLITFSINSSTTISKSENPDPWDTVILNNHQRIFYMFEYKKPICQETYLNMLGISLKHLRNVRKHLTTQGLTKRVHGNTDRMPQWKTKMVVDDNLKEELRNFLENYAEEYGLPDPGKIKNKKEDQSIIFLPTHMTYKSVHQDFIASRGEGDKLKSLKIGLFLKLWHQLVPHVKFQSPRSDVCDKCHALTKAIHDCSDENEREELKKNF